MRLLILVPGDVGGKMSGPAIRAWLLAKALSSRYQVTAAIEGQLPEDRPHGLRVIPGTRSRLLAETRRHDVVFAACLPPYVMLAARVAGVITIADHYDPVELELSTIGGRDRQMRAVRTLRQLQHQGVNAVTCASEAQRRMLLKELSSVGRQDGRQPPVAIVPLGIPGAPQRTGEQPLRNRFPAIRSSDKIVLWWGKIWSWFDAESAIKAFASLAASRPDIKLVITAGPAPDASTEAYTREREAMSLADRLGLLDRTVFFLREWLPYEERHHCLHEADLGLTLHADTPEAEVAARARYMDYLWAGLPCVLAAGDEISAQFASARFAREVSPGDVGAVTRTITELLDSPSSLAAARAAGEALADQYRWTTIAEHLSQFIHSIESPWPGGTSTVRLAGGASGYYVRRAIDKLVVAASGRRLVQGD